MVGETIALLSLIRDFYKDRQILSALFDWDGTRLEGSEKIVVRFSEHPLHRWHYSIEPIEGYEFIRLPVSANAVIESLGCLEGETNKDADYFWYIQVPQGGHDKYEDTGRNVRVRFMVFAYKKADLLSLGKKR